MRPHLRLVAVRAHTERNDTERREPREAIENAEHRVVEHRAVVDAGAHDDLPVHFHARVEQQLEPAQARRAAAVAQQPDPHFGIGRVNAHVERAQLLGDHPLEVGLREPGQRCEISVEERQAEIVVLEVQAAPHPFRELMDETERAMVVAGLHPVEDRVRELEPERRAFRLAHHELPFEAAPADFEVDLGAVGVQLVRDHVAELLAVDRQDLVAGRNSGVVRGRSGRDSKNTSGRHPTRLRVVHACIPSNAGGSTLNCVSSTPRRPVQTVLLAEPRGFCAGVEMAIKALAWMVRAFEPPVYCYHEIVHNRLVVERFREQGVVFVDNVSEVPPGAPLMLSAHGSAPEVVAEARAEGRYVVNAVCPLVTKVHHEAAVRARKGFTVLYVGHAGHDEAVGTLAVAPEAIRLVERADDLDAALADLGDRPQIAMLAQTTLAQGEWTGLLDEARSRAGDVWTASRNDLCFATTNRQGALTAIARARRSGGRDRQRQLVEHARPREGRA